MFFLGNQLIVIVVNIKMFHIFFSKKMIHLIYLKLTF